MKWIITYTHHFWDPIKRKRVKARKVLLPIGNDNEARNTVTNLQNNPDVSDVEIEQKQGVS